MSVRTMADGRTTVVALIGAKRAKNPKKPTVAELNAGLRLENHIKKSDYSLGSSGSTSVEEPVLGAKGKGTVPGPAEYSGSLTIFRYYDAATGKADVSGDDAIWQAFKTAGVEMDIYERDGIDPETPFKEGQEVDWYHVATGQPTKPSDRTEGYVKRTVALFVSDALENEITLTAAGGAGA